MHRALWNTLSGGALPVSLEKVMEPHSSTLAQKIPRMEEPGRLQSMGVQRVGRWMSESTSLPVSAGWWALRSLIQDTRNSSLPLSFLAKVGESIFPVSCNFRRPCWFELSPPLSKLFLSLNSYQFYPMTVLFASWQTAIHHKSIKTHLPKTNLLIYWSCLPQDFLSAVFLPPLFLNPYPNPCFYPASPSSESSGCPRLTLNLSFGGKLTFSWLALSKFAFG